ncbi:MAG: ABC transporter permease, partial [Gammaproteobacteria bacterium]|nr:ABC transporter permease [Gammaproteobacteria bacterium]
MSEAATTPAANNDKKKVTSQSYWSLVWWKFRKNRLAVIGAIILLFYFITCIFFAEFFAPYSKGLESDFIEAQPTYFQFRDADGSFSLRPFVYGLEEKIDTATRSRFYELNETVKYPIHFFVKGEPYKLLGLISTDIHLFGTDPADPEAKVFLLGTDRLGRDQFSRLLYGGRVSLVIGLFSVAVFLFIGVTLGAASG